MSRKPLAEIVREAEREEFPVFSKGNYAYTATTKHGRFSYFAPSFHIGLKLLTRKILKELQEDRRVLSVGCGKAYLEQLLIRRFSVPQENIELADINRDDIPEGFRSYIFDASGRFPEFDRNFDYVIFPASFTWTFYQGSGGSFQDSESCQSYYKIITQVLCILNPGGQMRGTDHALTGQRDYKILREELCRNGIGAALWFRPGLIVAEKACQNTGQ